MNPWDIAIPAAIATGVGTGLWAAVSPSAQLFGPVVRRLPEGGSTTRIALTFDDGPNPAITPRLMDLLERYQAHATFFVVGKFARACPELIREISARGHLLANHTDTHPHLAWHSSERNATELRRCEDSVAEALAAGVSRGDVTASGSGAVKMKWMRPPFGFRGPQLQGVLRKMGFDGVAMWSKLCYDWKPQPAENIIRRLANVRAGDIVLMHDGDHRALGGEREHVIGGLEHWLPQWRDAGMEFVTIEAAKPNHR